MPAVASGRHAVRVVRAKRVRLTRGGWSLDQGRPYVTADDQMDCS